MKIEAVIREREKVLADLKRAEETPALLAAIVNSSDDAIVSKTLQGIVTSWNTAAERMFGYSAEEMVGQSITRIIPEEYLAEETDILARLARGERIDHYPTVRRAKDGRLVDISLTISPIKDPEGNVIGASKIARDITEHKQTELALREATEQLVSINEDLERRVRERTAKLEQATAALLHEIEQQKILEAQLRQAQKMESLGTLAGGIAHDFNNLLNIILGYALSIPNDLNDAERVAQDVKVIRETVERGVAVVQQLLAIGRKTEVEFEPTDINQFLEHHIALLQGTFPKTIVISLRPDPKLPSILADPNRINQAILNLCVNARDAMAGAGELTIATESLPGAKLRKRYPEALEEAYVCISVSDSGPGIDKSVLERIFEPFFTTKRQGEGTGLGLTIVYGIAKDHDGFVDVESEPGRGTTFRLFLPQRSVDSRRSAAAEKTAPAVRPPNGATLLLADDEESQLRLIREMLAREGYRVLVAGDGVEAVELHRRHEEDIAAVILDLGLPKISGWESYLAMKKTDSAVRVLFTSGYIEPEIRLQMEGNGDVEVLNKPYAPEELLARIGEIIARKVDFHRALP